METADDLRETAMKRLKRRADFRTHLTVFLLVNALLWAIWIAGGGNGFPWPVFVTGGWGIGLVLDARDTYWRKPVTEADVQREIERLKGRT